MAQRDRVATRRVTLADVAARAGVSRATASRALVDDPRISPPTRHAVRDAAAHLRYVPNAAARSLRVRRTRVLGLLIADLSDPVHGQVAAGFEDEAARHGYSVVFVTGSNELDGERRAIRVFVEQGADAIALVSSVIDPAEARELAGVDRTLIVVQPDHAGMLRSRRRPPDGSIVTDDVGGVASAVRHLLATGHRRVMYLGSGDRPSNRLRQRALERVLEEAGLHPAAVVTLSEDAWREPDAVAAVIPDPLPDSIVCYDDKLALALLDGLRSVGRRVPEEVSVTGYDGIPFAALSNPRLTTVATPTVEMGRMAARSLIEALRAGQLPAGRVLPTELVVRESVRAARRTLAPRRPRSDLGSVAGGTR
jgi:LacI family transcriptional regulator